ncbi:beta-glucosidase 5-like [Euphorbia lathyris]|uniref:beta-glucosidase 5-like n=1 Tax=Euphorbia lathyris TaxID=212925 RepID=UPI003313E6E3
MTIGLGCKSKQKNAYVVEIKLIVQWLLNLTYCVLSIMKCSSRIMHPMVLGDYPATIKKNTGLRLPIFTNHESKQLKGPFYFVGVNHYASVLIKDNPIIPDLNFRDIFVDMAVDMIDCVSVALSGALFSWTKPLLLVISGINRGSSCVIICNCSVQLDCSSEMGLGTILLK